MPGVILYSYILIVLGVALVLVGVLSRRRKKRFNRIFLGLGGLLVVLGLGGLLFFITAFG